MVYLRVCARNARAQSDVSGKLFRLIFFRDVLNESVFQLAETLSLRTAHEWGEQLREVNRFTDAVLIALIESYEAQRAG